MIRLFLSIKVPIYENEIIVYLIEGITDGKRRDEARMQKNFF